jgi:hypothetical protein
MPALVVSFHSKRPVRCAPATVDHPIVAKLRRLERIRPRTLTILESVVDRLLAEYAEGGAR